MDKINKLPCELQLKIGRYIHNLNMTEVTTELSNVIFDKENILDNIDQISLHNSIQLLNITDNTMETHMFALAYRKYGNCTDFLISEKFESDRTMYYFILDITVDVSSKIIYIRRRYFELINRNGQHDQYKIVNNDVLELDMDSLLSEQSIINNCDQETEDSINLFIDDSNNGSWLIKKYYDRSFSEETVGTIIDYYFF